MATQTKNYQYDHFPKSDWVLVTLTIFCNNITQCTKGEFLLQKFFTGQIQSQSQSQRS